MAPLSSSARRSGLAGIGPKFVRHVTLAAVLALVGGCAGSQQHTPPEFKPAAQAADRCVEYRGNPTKYAQCRLLVGPDRYEFIPEIGRTADLATQLQCHFARFDLEAYAHCLGLEPRTANLEQQWPPPIAPTSSGFGEAEPTLGTDSTYIANLVVCLNAKQPGKCRYDMLASSHLAQVRRAEYRAVPEAAVGAVPDTLREHGEPIAAGAMTFMQARTANEVLKAQERRLRLQQMKGELVDRPRPWRRYSGSPGTSGMPG